MTWPSALVFVRHAQSTGNLCTPDERALLNTGSNLYDLTPLGEQQADHTRDWLAEHFPNPDGVYTSYYTRTGKTARRCYPDRKAYVDDRLAEAQRGIWHVRDRTWITEHRPEELERRELEGLYHYRPVGGENCPDVQLRIRSFNHTLHRRYVGRTVVIFCHGNWLLLWKMIIHHWSIEKYEAIYRDETRPERAANASVTIYRSVLEDTNGRGIIVPDRHTPYVVPWEGKLPGTATHPA